MHASTCTGSGPKRSERKRKVSGVRWQAGAALAAALLLFASSAEAAFFTITGPIPFNQSGVAGQIAKVTNFSGALPPALDGSVTNFFTQDWLVFQVDVTTGPVDEIWASVLGVTPAIGMSYYLDAGDQDPTSGFLDGATAKYDFGNGLNDPSKNIDTGESSARLVVSYALGDLSSAFGPVSFMVGAGPDFSVDGVIEEVPVPEPGLIALLGASLAGLGILRRPRRRK